MVFGALFKTKPTYKHFTEKGVSYVPGTYHNR